MKLNSLIDFLPYEFKDQDTYKVDGKGILERYLEIFGNYFQDIITEDTKGLLDIIDIDKTPAYYLNYLWEFLGELPFATTPIISQETWETYFSGFKDDATMEQLCNQWLNYRTGILEFDTDTVRKLLKCSIALFKIRGTKQFFEILFRLYGLGLTITDPVDENSDLWIPDLHPQYDLDDMAYDKDITYDNLYRCTQCVEVPITISGHGFTSVTDEFLSFKQSIDNLFRRFLPYNAKPQITYQGITLDYNYQIQAVPQNGTTLVRGQVDYIEILVTVTAYGGYKDADLRYEVSGDGVTWSSNKYDSPSIYIGKREGTYYFRSVGDNNAIATIVITRDIKVQDYRIQIRDVFHDVVLGSMPTVALPTWEENQAILPVEIIGTKLLNNQVVSEELAIRRVDTGEIKTSPAVWDITDSGTYKFVLVDYPQKSITLTVTKSEVFTIKCDPIRITYTGSDKTYTTLVTANSRYLNPSTINIYQVINKSNVFLGVSPYQFNTKDPGIYYFTALQDPKSTIVSFLVATQTVTPIIPSNLRFISGVDTNNEFEWDEDINLVGVIGIDTNWYQSTYDENRENLEQQLSTGVLEIYQDGSLKDTIPSSDLSLSVKSDGRMMINANYTITEPGAYTLSYTLNNTYLESVTYRVTQRSKPEEIRLIIVPIVNNPSNNGWSTADGTPYNPSSDEAKDGYSDLIFQFSDTNTECRFYLDRTDSAGGQAFSDINGGQYVNLGENNSLSYSRDNIKNGTYTFTLDRGIEEEAIEATLTIKKPAPKYTLTCNPPEFQLTVNSNIASTKVNISMNPEDTSGEYTYRVDTPNGIVTINPSTGYEFSTQTAGEYEFTVVDDPTVKATFKVTNLSSVSPDSLEWNATDTLEKEISIVTNDTNGWTAEITTTP